MLEELTLSRNCISKIDGKKMMSYFLYISFYVVLGNVFLLSSTFLFYIYRFV